MQTYRQAGYIIHILAPGELLGLVNQANARTSPAEWIERCRSIFPPEMYAAAIQECGGTCTNLKQFADAIGKQVAKFKQEMGALVVAQ